MGTRTEQKAATRESIIDAAEQLFGEKGLLSTTTAEIARAAGVSHGALFVHFSRRDDLQQEVISRVGTRIARAVHDASTDGAGLEAILRCHLNAIAAEEAFYSRLLSEGPTLGMAARSAIIGIQSAVAHHLFAGETGRLPDMALWFNTWLGLVHHYLLNRDLFAPTGSVLERYGETLIAHFTGLVARNGGKT